MFRSSLLTLVSLSFSVLLTAQGVTGVLKGKVIEEGSGKALAGISVMLSPFVAGTGTATDSLGEFIFPDVEVGLYDLAFISLTHEDRVLEEVWVRSGKESVVEVRLAPKTYQLGETVEVIERASLERMGTRSFTVEQSLRYAATFYDPARLVTTYPGVANVNDQANHMSVRGNNPNANKWFLEGLEVVSPNHLSSAGTPSDRPTLSGGGVNVLSAQMLRRSAFHNGVLPSELSNATGAIMDMKLRNGNADQTEWTAQAGLIGLDISNEGPISQKNGSSYLVNYRYSTLGLLGAMGVDLGDESISFQDISFNLTFPLANRHQLKIFGLGGQSDNEFESDPDPANWEIDKDSTDIDHHAEIAGVGAKANLLLSDRNSLEIGALYSSGTQKRIQGQGLLNDARDELLIDSFELLDRKLSARAVFRSNISSKVDLALGVNAVDRSLERELGSVEKSLGQGQYLRPFAQVGLDVSDLVAVEAHVGYAYWSLSEDAMLEGSLRSAFDLNEKSTLSLAIGQRAQLPDLQLIVQDVIVNDNSSLDNYRQIGFTVSQDVVVGFQTQFSNGPSLRVEAFFKQLSGIPQASNDSVYVENFGTLNSTNLFNNWNSSLNGEVVNEGNARTFGAELGVSQHFKKRFFYLANLSVFESTFGGDDGDAAGSRWDIGYTANLSGGKEFEKKKEGQTRTWGVSGRLNIMGGQKYTPIQRVTENTVTFGDPFSAQYDQFYRLDLRVYWRKYKEKKTGTLALDIQNATNAQNGFYDYYDTRKGEVITEYQLGIIPNLSYRIEF